MASNQEDDKQYQVFLFPTISFRFGKAPSIASNASQPPDKFKIKGELRESLLSRYQLKVHINTSAGSVLSYCYYRDGDSREEATCYPVRIIDLAFLHPTLFPAPYNTKWLELSHQGRAGLVGIFNMPTNLWRTIEYDDEKEKWFSRNEDDKMNMSSISTYGAERPCVLDHLKDGLSQEEREYVNEELVSDWNSMFRSGMTSGEGCTAVYHLFKEIIRLLPHVNITNHVEVFHHTSSLKHESFVIAEAECESDSRSSLSGPSMKRQKVDILESDNDSEGRREDGKWPTRHCHLVDLVVVSRDTRTSLAKYLALIKIQTGEDNDEAKHIIEEIIFALQCQNTVSGFLFSREYAIVYQAERLATEEIKIRRMKYDLTDRSSLPDTLHVGHLQILIMDIFTCLIYGLDQIVPIWALNTNTCT